MLSRPRPQLTLGRCDNGNLESIHFHNCHILHHKVSTCIHIYHGMIILSTIMIVMNPTYFLPKKENAAKPPQADSLQQSSPVTYESNNGHIVCVGGTFHAKILATSFIAMIGITSIFFSKAARTLGQLLASLFIRLYLNHWVPHGVHNHR